MRSTRSQPNSESPLSKHTDVGRDVWLLCSAGMDTSSSSLNSPAYARLINGATLSFPFKQPGIADSGLFCVLKRQKSRSMGLDLEQTITSVERAPGWVSCLYFRGILSEEPVSTADEKLYKCRYEYHLKVRRDDSVPPHHYDWLIALSKVSLQIGLNGLNWWKWLESLERNSPTQTSPLLVTSKSKWIKMMIYESELV